MKAISLHAPWGTLLHTRKPRPYDCDCMVPSLDGDGQHSPGCRVFKDPAHPLPMVKRFETRSWPCPPSIIGQRIAIHQAKRRPWKESDGPGERAAAMMQVVPRNLSMAMITAGIELPLLWSSQVPLGCIVASGVITRSLPIVDCNDMDHNGQHRLLRVRENELWITAKSGPPRDITDQLPYGDFTPGRWAWELSDVAATTERCPQCWGRGVVNILPTREMSVEALQSGALIEGDRCSACNGDGKCEPIPAVGRQRFWEWRAWP